MSLIILYVPIFFKLHCDFNQQCLKNRIFAVGSLVLCRFYVSQSKHIHITLYVEKRIRGA